MASNNESDFLKRWSRRKIEESKTEEREAEQPDLKPDSGDDDAPVQAQDEPGGEQTETGETATDAENITIDESEFDDVDFELLDFNSDFTRFMKKGVPESIQRRALRKLWGSDPILANIDGLNDYDEDYTDKALAVKALKTAYKVGSGYLTEEDYNTDEVPDTEDGESAEDVTASNEDVEPDEDKLAAGTDDEGDAGDKDNTEILSQGDAENAQEITSPEVKDKHKG